MQRDELVSYLDEYLDAQNGEDYCPNGLQIGKMRTPLGVIGIIYESRPNVTIDAASLCIKSGNASILRIGRQL